MADRIKVMKNPLSIGELSDCIDAAGYPCGTAVAVGVSGPFDADIVKTTGFTPEGIAFAPDTMIYTGSLAKQVTAACAAMLVQSGELNTDHAITNWLEELPAWADSIRVRHLIHHTADFPAEVVVSDEMQAFRTQDRTSLGVIEALARLSNHQANPGVAYDYSGCGYICLALIIERVTAKPLSVFANEYIFKPLNMSNSCFWSGPESKPGRGVALGKALAPAPLSLGDGGLWSTLFDLLRWNDGLNYRKLSVSDMVHTVGSLDDGTPLDYAWGTRVFTDHGVQIQSHGGSWPGSTARLLRLPEHKLSIAALALDDDVDRIVAMSAAILDFLRVRVAAPR